MVIEMVQGGWKGIPGLLSIVCLRTTEMSEHITFGQPTANNAFTGNLAELLIFSRTII